MKVTLEAEVRPLQALESQSPAETVVAKVDSLRIAIRSLVIIIRLNSKRMQHLISFQVKVVLSMPKKAKRPSERGQLHKFSKLITLCKLIKL